MDPKFTALLLVDDSNDFLSGGGKFNGALTPRNAVSRINDAVRAARAAGITVVRAPLSYSPDFREMGDEPYGVFAAIRDAGAFIKGSWGAAPAESIDGAPSDLVIEGKHTMDTFASTGLDALLRERSIRTLVVAGVLSNLCVSSTMRTAYDRGYQVVALTDACAALSDAHHDGAVANDWPLFSTPMSTTDFCNSFSL